jgi:thiol-disulfide isomerase/thioredoxin
MGLNLKEKWQNANKKNVAIIAISMVVVLGALIGSISFYQQHQLKVAQEKARQNYANLPFNISSEAPKKPSDYNIGIEYNKAMKEGKPIVALFYADWCRYCIRFMPIYQELAEKYQASVNFTKVNVEDKKYEKLVNNIGITGFPTVFILDPKYDNRVLLSNAILNNADSVSVEIDRFLRIRKLLDDKK